MSPEDMPSTTSDLLARVVALYERQLGIGQVAQATRVIALCRAAVFTSLAITFDLSTRL